MIYAGLFRFVGRGDLFECNPVQTGIGTSVRFSNLHGQSPIFDCNLDL